MLIDTNILVYAINADSPKHTTAQSFLQHESRRLILAHQNILEAMRVLTHPKHASPMKSHEAQAALWEIVEICRIIYPNNKTHYLALELITVNNLVGNHIFDAYLAATALSNGIQMIATDNTKDFTSFGLQLINPFKS